MADAGSFGMRSRPIRRPSGWRAKSPRRSRGIRCRNILFATMTEHLAAHSKLASERWASGTDPRRSARPGIDTRESSLPWNKKRRSDCLGCRFRCSLGLILDRVRCNFFIRGSHSASQATVLDKWKLLIMPRTLIKPHKGDISHRNMGTVTIAHFGVPRRADSAEPEVPVNWRRACELKA